MDIVTLAAARKGGGSGGDVTKQYVDDHLALKADKSETKEYPIADSVSGSAISVTNSADGYVQGLTVYGRSRVSKNLFDKTAQNATNGFVSDNYIFDTGSYNSSNLYNVSEYIEVNPSTQYTLSGMMNYQSSYPSVCYYTEDHAYISGEALDQQTIKTITVPQNAKYIRFSILKASVDTIQLELGSVATPYEPYGIISIGDSGSLTITTANSDNTESSTATLTTGLPYCGIPVTSGETYTDASGQKWLADEMTVEGVVKRCGVIEDLSQLNWTFKSDPGWETFFCVLPNANAKSHGGGLVSSEYLTFKQTAPVGDHGIIIIAQGQLVCNINEYKDPVDIDGFKAAIAGIKLIYELASPTTQELTTAEKSALLNLKTYSPTTNVTVTDSPTVDIGYLLNTTNGQAVANAIDNAITSVLNTSY